VLVSQLAGKTIVITGAGSAVFLLSDVSAFVTGQVLPVNGGFVFN
jgi:enoyl-[acyl-carrier-protein] reductase (NADH)